MFIEYVQLDLNQKKKNLMFLARKFITRKFIIRKFIAEKNYHKKIHHNFKAIFFLNSSRKKTKRSKNLV